MQNGFNKKKSLLISVLVLILSLELVMVGCKENSPIGEIVSQAPITTLVYESDTNGGDSVLGVVYRKVNDVNKLLAQRDMPVLVVFMDGRTLSNKAIPFTEELCDKFSNTARIIRVNVDLSEQSDQIQSLVDLFGVGSYPWFAMTNKGEKKSAITGYSKDLEDDIIDLLENEVNK